MGLHFSVPVRGIGILLFLLGSIAIGCTSSKKSSSEEGENAKLEQSDSLFSNNQDMKPENLAPGTAHLVLKELDISEQDNGEVGMQALVVRIMGYGPATPPLSPGNTITIDASEYFRNVVTKPNSLADLDSLNCLVASQGNGPSPNSGNSRSSFWKLMNIYSK